MKLKEIIMYPYHLLKIKQLSTLQKLAIHLPLMAGQYVVMGVHLFGPGLELCLHSDTSHTYLSILIFVPPCDLFVQQTGPLASGINVPASALGCCSCVGVVSHAPLFLVL